MVLSRSLGLEAAPCSLQAAWARSLSCLIYLLHRVAALSPVPLPLCLAVPLGPHPLGVFLPVASPFGSVGARPPQSFSAGAQRLVSPLADSAMVAAGSSPCGLCLWAPASLPIPPFPRSTCAPLVSLSCLMSPPEQELQEAEGGPLIHCCTPTEASAQN